MFPEKNIAKTNTLYDFFYIQRSPSDFPLNVAFMFVPRIMSCLGETADIWKSWCTIRTKLIILQEPTCSLKNDNVFFCFFYRLCMKGLQTSAIPLRTTASGDPSLISFFFPLLWASLKKAAATVTVAFQLKGMRWNSQHLSARILWGFLM